MDKFKFKELLMNIAVCAMSCDGDIDEKEITALKKIEKETPYFSEIDLSKKLESALKKCKNDLESFKKNIINNLKKNKLTTRDSRVVERKKYGHKKARRSFQFSKR